MQCVTKIRQDNDVIDHIGAFYTKIDTKLSWPIKSGASCDKNQIGQHLTDHTYVVYIRNEA